MNLMISYELIWPRIKNERRKGTSKHFEMLYTWEKKGRPRNSQMHEVKTKMRKKGINNMEWIDSE